MVYVKYLSALILAAVLALPLLSAFSGSAWARDPLEPEIYRTKCQNLWKGYAVENKISEELYDSGKGSCETLFNMVAGAKADSQEYRQCVIDSYTYFGDNSPHCKTGDPLITELCLSDTLRRYQALLEKCN